MFARLAIVALLLANLPLWSQVEPGASGSDSTTDSNAEMTVPPPVAGVPYPKIAAPENLPNYMSAEINASAGYINNVFPFQSATTPIKPVNDEIYTFYPTLRVIRATVRRQVTASYSPSFVFYQNTTALDTIDHGASLTFQDRFSPHITFNVEDFFYRTSDVFDQSYLFSGGGVTGSTQTPATILIAPSEQQLSNLAHAFLSYQFGRDGMIGGGASDSTYYFSAPSSATGLGNSHANGAWVFYNRRVSARQYLGVSYQWSRTAAQTLLQRGYTQTNSVLPFYSFYLTKTTSVSLSGGALQVNVTSPNLPASNSWSPEADISVGYQGKRGFLAGSYSYTITSGEGLLGAYITNNANLSGGWNLTPTWTAAVSATYANATNKTPQLFTSTGGNMIAGQASITHVFRESLRMNIGYERLHENFSNIPIISANPDSNQVYGKITYEFRKPMGK
ncbi:MAG TPA: hypothetical protein VIJ38_18365 [Acidobacteriaceae bacterium]